MFYQLPPVGNPVCLNTHEHDQADTVMPVLFPMYKTQFYASGTAALAAAIVAVLNAATNIDNFSEAEIILPAYGCPDLVSAVLFAGAKPVLVDLEANRPWMDLTQLAAVTTEKTVAIVAVNLFGIAERWPQLRELVEQKNIVLIEDSAQYFPADSAQQDWHGDLTVLSFGRGKPVSMLGGGAVITTEEKLYEQLPKPLKIVASLTQRFSFGVKARLYNAMVSPFLYWLPQSLPFLHLGETRYHSLVSIEALDQTRLSLLMSNVSRYQNDAGAAVRCEKISSMLNSLGHINNLPQACNTEENHRLLRYPLLLEAAFRDRVYQKLRQAGLGASIMYPAILPKIAGMELLLDSKQDFPNAEAFASQLITLPTHSSLSEKEIKKIKVILGSL